MENNLITRRHALALGGIALLAPQSAVAASTKPVLIELFTSQGCSSCPPADELAGELANDPNTVVVSFNVDYWDYLGWRDTLAKPEYSKRQYDYAKTRGDGSVYTPQMVFNGVSHAVGSNRREVKQQIAEGEKLQRVCEVKLNISKNSVSVEIEKANYQGEATLWLMAVEPKVLQKIQKGENAGKDITYVNVVKNLIPAAMWSGEAYKGSWMRDVVMTKGTQHVIAVLQEGKTGKLLGLAQA